MQLRVRYNTVILTGSVQFPVDVVSCIVPWKRRVRGHTWPSITDQCWETDSADTLSGESESVNYWLRFQRDRKKPDKIEKYDQQLCVLGGEARFKIPLL